LYSAKVW